MTLDTSVTAPTPKKTTTVLSARRKLELSKVNPAAVQRETMGTDVDIGKFLLYFSQRVETDLTQRVVDAQVSRTMDGSSILTATINDYDRVLLSSGFLANKLDVEVDGLWFRLTGTDKSGDELVLTFEDRAVAVLRTYTKWKQARRSKVTRAEFVMNLINEVKEFEIPVVIPELHTVQPIERFNGDIIGHDYFVNKGQGISKDTNQQKNNKLVITHGKFPKVLTDVKGVPDKSSYLYDAQNNLASPDQIGNVNTILAVGKQMTKSRKLYVCAIMTALAESNLEITSSAKGDGFFNQVLQQLGITETQQTIDFLNQWAHHESPPNDIDGYNLLGLTRQVNDSYGTGQYNIQSYSSAKDGITANVLMFNQSNFTHVKAALATGNPNSMQNDAKTQAEFLHWSGSGYSWPTLPGPYPTTPIIAHATDGSNPIPSSSKTKAAQDTKGAIGLFNQTHGSEHDRLDPETSARVWFNQAINNSKLVSFDTGKPYTYNELCQSVQHNKNPLVYGQYRERAEKFVTAWGTPGGENATLAASANSQTQNSQPAGDYYFYRGNISGDKNRRIRKPENSWDCIQRLAGEVDWRAFFVGGVFYFISEDDLLKAQPLLTLDEFAEGIIDVSGEFHNNKKSASMTIQARVGRWDVPPGGVVVVKDMGPFDGRWLVSEYARSLFDLNATITMLRERPQLPEPRTGNKNVLPSWSTASSNTANGSSQGSGQGGPAPDVPTGSGVVADLAQQLLALHNKGWTDDNGQGYQQIWDQANGHKLNPPNGPGPCNLDPRILKTVLWLIQDQKLNIGTYAWCTDHGNDGAHGHGHVNGFCVDISSVNNTAIKSDVQAAYDGMIKVDKLLWNINGPMRPVQLISGGHGNHRDLQALALCLPNWQFYNYVDPSTGKLVIDEHCNHIHVGYS